MAKGEFPRVRDIKSGEVKLRRRLTYLFNHRSALWGFPRHLSLGERRISAQAQFALHITRYMRAGGYRNIPEFLSAHYLGEDNADVVRWMRDPFTLSQTCGKRVSDEFLLALSGLSFDPKTKSYIATEDPRTGKALVRT